MDLKQFVCEHGGLCNIIDLDAGLNSLRGSSDFIYVAEDPLRFGAAPRCIELSALMPLHRVVQRKIEQFIGYSADIPPLYRTLSPPGTEHKILEYWRRLLSETALAYSPSLDGRRAQTDCHEYAAEVIRSERAVASSQQAFKLTMDELSILHTDHRYPKDKPKFVIPVENILFAKGEDMNRFLMFTSVYKHKNLTYVMHATKEEIAVFVRAGLLDRLLTSVSPV
jgi:hypothetical protein